MNSIISGTGSYLPPISMSNDDIAKLVTTSDEWIYERTGIKGRHIAKEDTTVSMAVKAAKAALEDANISAKDLDLIIVGTISADELLPSTACRVQASLGASKAVAFDVNAACSGFLFAMSIANAYIKSNTCKHALIIGVETLSKITDWTDRGTCVLFGDGGGAAILSASQDKGIIQINQGSDGCGGDKLYCLSRSNENPYTSTDKGLGYITMDGPSIFKFAIKQVPKVINNLINDNNLNIDDISLFVLHQANLRILNTISKRLDIPMDKIPANMDECGNTSAASVPILLDHLNKSGKLKSGDLIIVAGFGAGLTWGGALLYWH